MSVKRVEKPWGYEIIYAVTPQYVGKILFIRKGHQLSLQFHKKKDETIYIQTGHLKFLTALNQNSPLKELELKPGDSFHIPPGVVHRMIALEDTHVLEVSTPELDDVVRLQDQYGRT